MAERRFSAEIVVGRDPEDVFEWVADYRHVSQALEGVSRWQPLQERTRGKGARFDVSMSALGFPLDNVLVLDEWKQASAIGWRSESGLVRQTGRWRFDPDAAGTRVSLSIGYVAPFGFVGRLVAREVETLVTARLQRALARMKEILEAEVRRAG
jgi:uncharacterized membrane protein